MISVLLIDDDPELLEIIRLALEDERDFTIQTCTSPEIAIEITRKQVFDSLVCDFSMPVMNGCSLLHILRSQGCTAQFILYTATEKEDKITNALTHGVDIYLQRRGNPEAELHQLKEIIRTAFRKNE